MLKLRHALAILALLLPATLLVGVGFVAPIAGFLYRSVDNAEIPAALPMTVAALQHWDGTGNPDPAVYAAFVKDMQAVRGTYALPALMRRLSYNEAWFRPLISRTSSALSKLETIDDPQQALVDIDPRWGTREPWRILRLDSGRLTPLYLLGTIDLQRDVDGKIISVDEDRAIYVDTLARTFWISAVVSLTCFLIGYPFAVALTTVSPAVQKWLIYVTVLPLWISALVRTLAWLVLFQKHGVVNDLMIAIGLIKEPIQLLYTRTAVYVAMVYIMLPFMVLPIFAVMKKIPRSYMQAALSLGASPARAFLTVYFPQTLSGVGAGFLLVSVLVLGFYITPDLLGGPGDRMISQVIAFFANEGGSWGRAAAAGVLLLVLATAMILSIHKVTGARPGGVSK